MSRIILLCSLMLFNYAGIKAMEVTLSKDKGKKVKKYGTSSTNPFTINYDKEDLEDRMERGNLPSSAVDIERSMHTVAGELKGRMKHIEYLVHRIEKVKMCNALSTTLCFLALWGVVLWVELDKLGMKLG